MRKNPIIFSNAFRFIILIVGGVLLSIGLISFGTPKLVVFTLIIVLYISITVLWPIYILYKAKSIKAIDRYIITNYKKPIFAYSYALGHGNKRDIEDALKRIMNTYTQEDMYHVYGANLSIHNNKPDDIIDHAKEIKGQEYKNYYIGYANVLKGDFDKAREFLLNLRTPWMIHSLKAAAAKKRGNLDEFRAEADKSIKSAIGMQRYVLHHTMRRFEDESFASLKKNSERRRSNSTNVGKTDV